MAVLLTIISVGCSIIHLLSITRCRLLCSGAASITARRYRPHPEPTLNDWRQAVARAGQDGRMPRGCGEQRELAGDAGRFRDAGPAAASHGTVAPNAPAPASAITSRKARQAAGNRGLRRLMASSAQTEYARTSRRTVSSRALPASPSPHHGQLAAQRQTTQPRIR